MATGPIASVRCSKRVHGTTLPWLPVEKISSASCSSAGRMVRSCTAIPLARSRAMTRWRVMPLRKVPFGTGVGTAPSLTSITFWAVNSARLPIGSHIPALSKPRPFASVTASIASG